jgi:hypothetical protein
MLAWLEHADPKTLLLPDFLVGRERLYTPHNAGADLYPYLVLTAELTEPSIYGGRMLDMLRGEILQSSPDGQPWEVDLLTHQPVRLRLFGAGEYAKDGLVAVTEALGRTPWFYRMADMIAAAMERAPVETRFGRLPATDSELNGDFLQVLARLYPMTGDPRYLAWARRIGDAYLEEVLPLNHGVPALEWDFAARRGDGRLRLRDHGNETIVGLALLAALEDDLGSPRAARTREAVARMLDRVLESANPDGLLYNVVDPATLKPLDERLSDNWGYVYGAVYTMHMITREARYRDAVRRVLANLPKYRGYAWEPSDRARDKALGSFDGYADSIESALYLVAREPVPEAADWIDSEMRRMLALQRPDGHVEGWYVEGNFNRTALLHALWKSQGARPVAWRPGFGVGAVRDGARLVLHTRLPGRVRFDFARHRRVLNFRRNYVRLNEFPEHWVADENTLYEIRPASGGAAQVRLGSELIAGIELAAGDWVVSPRGSSPAK